MTQTQTLPDWWPDWMAPPVPNELGHTPPLGKCRDCGGQQYPMSFAESHFSSCSRAEPVRGPRRSVPWPRDWR